MKKLFVLLSALLGLSLSGQAQTQIPIQNPSFEQIVVLPDNTGHGNWNQGPIPGWVLAGNGGVWQPTTDRFALVPDGIQVAYLSSGTITQDLQVSVQPGTYSFTYQQGRRDDGAGDSATCSVSLLAGTTILQSNSVANTTLPLGAFQPQNFSFTVSSATLGDLTLQLSSTGPQCVFDEFSSVTFTPAVMLPTVTLTVNSGSNLLWDDGTAILPGPFTVGQLQNPTTDTGIGTITSDANGNLTGSLTVNPNWTDANGNLNFVFGIPAVPNAITYPVPVAQFQHGATGLTINLVLYKQGALAIKSQTLGLTP